MRTSSLILTRFVGLFMNRRDLSGALPAGSYTPLLIAAGIVVAVFGIADFVALIRH